jgi:hypothetical protein
MGKMPGLTYAYVIGRSGGVVWKGDPSRDTDEFQEAVSAALSAPRARALPETSDEELSEAVAEYVLGDFAKARKLAEKVAGKFGKKKGEDAERIAAEASALLALVDGTLEDLAASLDAAFEVRDPEAFETAARALRAAFPKSDAAGAIDGRLTEDPDFAGSVEAWSAWIELRDARPPAFPLRREKPEAKYAKALEKFLKKNEGAPGAEQAGAWLEQYESAE